MRRAVAQLDPSALQIGGVERVHGGGFSGAVHRRARSLVRIAAFQLDLVSLSVVLQSCGDGGCGDDGVEVQTWRLHDALRARLSRLGVTCNQGKSNILKSYYFKLWLARLCCKYQAIQAHLEIIFL